ncbi:uncharacterized protein LOC107020537 [Solanum pennellii]|uniref:Uncharacterized protein LOC107020537 n=1 Tax=Solanum pennellii TaxID=28526 RepID=A0ABM1GV39_SOLPN|nr:uncharacterized protein LOC107020537 [Solanum pennellii]
MVIGFWPCPRCRRWIIIPPEGTVTVHPTRRNVEEREVPNAPEMQPKEEVTNARFCLASGKEGRAAMLIGDMDISRLMDYRSGSSRPQFKKQKDNAPSSDSVPTPRNNGEYNGHKSLNIKDSPAHSQGSVAQRGSWDPSFGRCRRNHVDKCCNGQSGCFKCGEVGHYMKELPKNKKRGGNLGNRVQSASVAPPHKAAPREVTYARCYHEHDRSLYF